MWKKVLTLKKLASFLLEPPLEFKLCDSIKLNNLPEIDLYSKGNFIIVFPKSDIEADETNSTATPDIDTNTLINQFFSENYA